MPRDRNGLGFNELSSPVKNDIVGDALGPMYGSAVAVAKRYGGISLIVDPFAGPGRYPVNKETVIDGSPIKGARHIAYHNSKGSYNNGFLICAEKNYQSRECLKDVLEEEVPSLIRDRRVAICSSQVAAFEEVDKARQVIPDQKITGVIYLDPCAWGEISNRIDILGAFSSTKLDVLLTIACQGQIRALGVWRNGGYINKPLTISDYLQSTQRKKLYVRQFAKIDRWSFGVGSNWMSRPVDHFSNLGFLDLDTNEGRELTLELSGGEAPPISWDEYFAKVRGNF